MDSILLEDNPHLFLIKMTQPILTKFMMLI